MEVLIIGGTGNLSGSLLPLLLQRGDKVTLVNRGNRPISLDCKHIQVDINNTEDFKAKIAGVKTDCVIDFMCFEMEQAQLDYNIFRGNTGQFIFISTCMVYKKPHIRIPVTEDHPLGNPYSEYGRNKAAIENFLVEVSSKDFPVTIVRPSHTCGISWIPSPIGHSMDFTIARRIEEGRQIFVHDEGQSLWTLTASSDFAKGLIGLVGNKTSCGEAFHITSDEPQSWNSIYQEIGMALGHEPDIVHIPTDFLCDIDSTFLEKLRGDKAEHGVFDNKKIKKYVPGFACKKTFRIMIRESIAWYRENPERQIILQEQDEFIDRVITRWNQTNKKNH